jgi:probable HAF family extracellular repeat protein
MFSDRMPGNSGNALNSVLCLALSLSPILLTTTASAQLLDGRQFAYVANQDAGQVSGYTLNAATGKLVPVEGSPFNSGKSGPTSVAVTAAGTFLYTTNPFSGDNDVAGFQIQGETGKLIPVHGSPFRAGGGPTAIAIDPLGKFAYVANQRTNDVSAFRIDNQSGRLIPVSGATYPAGTGPSSIAVDALGQSVYVTNESSNNLSGYTINRQTGALTPMTGSPFATGTHPVSVAVDPNDRFLYVANQGSDNISGFGIDSTTGTLYTLTASPWAAGSGGVRSVSVDPSGGFVYLAGYGGVFAYTIGQDNGNFGAYGALTSIPGSPFGGGAPGFVTADYTGTFLYAANKAANDISLFTLASGSLGSPATMSAGPGPVSIALVRPRSLVLFNATEVPPLPGIYGSNQKYFPAAVNNLGQVTGTATFSGGSEQFRGAYLYSNGATDTIAQTRSSYGNNLSDTGLAVGQSGFTAIGNALPLQAFVYNSNSKTNVVIDNVPGRQSNALAVNNAGQVTGSLSTATCFNPFNCNLGATHAFLYSGSGLVDIGTLSGGYSQGTSINNHGEIAGIASVSGNTLNHLFLYAQGNMRDLGAPKGESVVSAVMNDHGDILVTTGGNSYLHRGNSFEKLGFAATDLNDLGAIVGARIAANKSSHALAYFLGKSIDLNELTDPSLPLFISAIGISGNNKILVTGLNGHQYVLAPK